MRLQRLWWPCFILVACCLLGQPVSSGLGGGGDIVYAVNCGGEAHTDSQGWIHYQADPVSVGTASDYGKQLVISRVPPPDQILYQTERYHTATFGYDIPVSRGDGNYVLVLKFSEVYFNAPGMKVR